MEKIKKIVTHQLFLPIASLGILLLYNLIFVPDFFSVSIVNGQIHGRIIDILNRASSLIIISVGLTFVVATRGIDLSIGSVIAITGAVSAYLVGGTTGSDLKLPFPLVILLSMLIGTICGLWNGFLVSKLNIQPIIATLILQTAGRGIAMLITQGQILTVYYNPFSWIGNNIPGFPLPTTIFIALTVIIIVAFVLKLTAIGTFVQSIGINREAAKYSGIKVSGIILLCYMFCGLCASISGLIEVSMISAADANNAGLNFEANAILSVALGGTLLSGGKFTLAGSIIGAITIQTLTTTMFASGVSSVHLPVVQGLVILLIISFQSKTFKEKMSVFKKKVVKS